MSNLLKAKEKLEKAVSMSNADYTTYQILPSIRDALDFVNAELALNPPPVEEAVEVSVAPDDTVSTSGTDDGPESDGAAVSDDADADADADADTDEEKKPRGRRASAASESE